MNNLHDIKVGAAASILTPLAFSTGMQLGEKGEVSLNRTTLSIVLQLNMNAK